MFCQAATGRQMNSGRTLSDTRLGVARKNLLTSRPNKALAMVQIVLMVHQRQASILGELRRFSVLAGTLARLIHLLGTGGSVGGRARGDISVIAPRSASSAFVTEMPATARGTASRPPADPFTLPPGGIWRARAPVRTPVLLNNHDPRTRSEERRVGKECRSRW